jgi:hypothetical protein
VGELWTPGGPSADDFVTRVHQQVARFAERRGVLQAKVEVELRDGALLVLDSFSSEPGYGFVTLCPHPENEREREELIVPLASIAQIRISSAEEEPRFGFALPDAAAQSPSK